MKNFTLIIIATVTLLSILGCGDDGGADQQRSATTSHTVTPEQIANATFTGIYDETA